MKDISTITSPMIKTTSILSRNNFAQLFKLSLQIRMNSSSRSIKDELTHLQSIMY